MANPTTPCGAMAGAGDQEGAADVEAVGLAGLASGGAEDDGGQGGGGQADRDVDQEHRAPAGELDQDAAEDLAGDEADGGDRTVQPDGPRTPRAGVSCAGVLVAGGVSGGAGVAGGVWGDAVPGMIPIRYVTDRFGFPEGRTGR
jgi:hypothetical protein